MTREELDRAVELCRPERFFWDPLPTRSQRYWLQRIKTGADTCRIPLQTLRVLLARGWARGWQSGPAGRIALFITQTGDLTLLHGLIRVSKSASPSVAKD